jgi:hypothetical protein
MLRQRYDISLEEFALLLASQTNDEGITFCAACHEPRSKGYRWSVDHDHKVEVMHGVRASIRGLVCRRCNKVMRDVRDNWLILRLIAEFILNPPAQEILNAIQDR